MQKVVYSISKVNKDKSADYDTNLCLYKRPNSPPIKEASQKCLLFLL